LLPFKELAKTRKWRERYKLSFLTGIPMFKGPVSEWTDHQVEFVSCCHFYYFWSYEASERPSEKTLMDDQAMESWLIALDNKRRKEEMQSRLGSHRTSGEGFSFRQ
jgi:hypothetical protein